jgi:hypothetical protein
MFSNREFLRFLPFDFEFQAETGTGAALRDGLKVGTPQPAAHFPIQTLISKIGPFKDLHLEPRGSLVIANRLCSKLAFWILACKSHGP